MNARRNILAASLAAAFLALLGPQAQAQAPKVIKISHQFPGGTLDEGDFRGSRPLLPLAQNAKRLGHVVVQPPAGFLVDDPAETNVGELEGLSGFRLRDFVNLAVRPGVDVRPEVWNQGPGEIQEHGDLVRGAGDIRDPDHLHSVLAGLPGLSGFRARCRRDDKGHLI